MTCLNIFWSNRVNSEHSSWHRSFWVMNITDLKVSSSLFKASIHVSVHILKCLPNINFVLCISVFPNSNWWLTTLTAPSISLSSNNVIKGEKIKIIWTETVAQWCLFLQNWISLLLFLTHSKVREYIDSVCVCTRTILFCVIVFLYSIF